MFLSLSIHFIPARTQSSDNVQIGPTFLDGDNDQSNGEQLSKQFDFRQISGPPEQVFSRFVEYSLCILEKKFVPDSDTVSKA